MKAAESQHPAVKPGSVWADGTIFRVVKRVGEHMVAVEAIRRLDDDPRPVEEHQLVHVDWLDGGLFLGRVIQDASPDA